MLIFKPSNQEKKENNMRVVTSLLMLGLMTGVSANYANAQVHGAVKGVEVAAKSVDEVVEIALKALDLNGKLKTEEKIEFGKKIDAMGLFRKQLSAEQITKLIKTDASYISIRGSYSAKAQANVKAMSTEGTTKYYTTLDAAGTQKGYNPSVEATTKIWSEILGMEAKHGELVHNALMKTVEGQDSLKKIAAWQMAFTRNLGSDTDKAALLKLIDLETIAAAKHIKVTGNRVCENLSGEGLEGFANYIEQVVKTAKVNMTSAELKAHMEKVYSERFNKNGEQALKEVCAHCPGTITCI